MRYLGDVIEQILEVSTNEELNLALKEVEYDLGFKAPELHYTLWNRVGYYLNEIYPNPLKNEETLKIASIFTTLTEDELKKQFAV